MSIQTPWDRWGAALERSRQLHDAADKVVDEAHKELTEAQKRCNHVMRGGFMFSQCILCGIDDL